MTEALPVPDRQGLLIGTSRELLQVAIAAIGDGAAARAAAIARGVAAKEPGNADAWLVLAHAALACGEATAAADAAARAEAIRPGRPDQAEVHAAALEAAGRTEEAVAAARSLASLRPQATEPQLRLARLLEAAGARAAATAALRRACRLSPADPKPRFNLGNLLSRAGRPKAACVAYDAALSLNPNFASARYNRGTTLYRLGRKSEAAHDLEAALALQEAWPEAHTALAAALRDLGRPADALRHAERAVALSAPSAEALNNLGLALMAIRRAQEALPAFDRALAIDPGDAEIRNNRGVALADLGRHAAALADFRHALALRPGWADARLNLANVLRAVGHVDGAVAACRALLADHPDDFRIAGSLGAALIAAGRPDEAIPAYRHAIALAPDEPELRKGFAIAQLTLGDYRSGWANYEWRLRCDDAPRRHASLPLWQGPGAACGSLLVHSEQGFGDTLQFCRYLPLLASYLPGTRVHFEVPPALYRLMCGLDGSVTVCARGAPTPQADAQVPLLSLPHRLGTDAESIPDTVPYLQADPDAVAGWRRRLGEGPAVGIVWAGNPHRQDDHLRSCPPGALAPLLATPGIAFVNLQIGSDLPPDLPALRNALAVAPEIGDFADTAAIVAALDLVITVDTATAHLAGALGRPVWVLLGHGADWRYLVGRADSPWYPTMQLFRQNRAGDWSTLAGRVAAALRDWRNRIAG